jgi:hypothetical protein
MRRLQKCLARALQTASARRRRAALITLAVIACLALVAPALAQVPAIYDLSWHTIAGGGGKMESAQLTLQGTVGQAVTGQASSGGRTLCSGFWCNGSSAAEKPEDYPVYLPLVVRGTP